MSDKPTARCASPHRNPKDFPLLVTVKCRRLLMLQATDLGLPVGGLKDDYSCYDVDGAAWKRTGIGRRS